MFMMGTCKKTSLDIYGTARVELERKPWAEACSGNPKRRSVELENLRIMRAVESENKANCRIRK